ncbi:MAG: hypothetical protein JOY71_01230 [Acetobacteraceae bacterium]|nr:hypothetical protein [Acetobacteraceae bacterium]MBV8520750.1 hypothetical protein [Acetobacteraceae bacterium]MBV8588914.1 hypothetical protein [Acetobacteraceae bacterium]
MLGGLTAIGPVSTDMYLPAFPAIEADLGSPAGTAQITLPTWFAGLAFGPITQGALADCYGRRGPLSRRHLSVRAGRGRVRVGAEPVLALPCPRCGRLRPDRREWLYRERSFAISPKDMKRPG